METVIERIVQVFGHILYPALVIGTFLSMIIIIIYIISEATDSERRIRRSIAAFLPIVTLTFMIARREQASGEVPYIIELLPSFLKLVVGFLIGGALIKLGELAASADSEVGPSLYGLFTSSLCSFLIWSLIGGYLNEIDMLILGFILGGGIWIVFVGVKL